VGRQYNTARTFACATDQILGCELLAGRIWNVIVRLLALMKSFWLWAGLALLAVAGVAYWQWGARLGQWSDALLTLFGQDQALTHFVELLGWAGPPALIAINALQIVIAPLPNYAIFVVAGFLYGPLWGGIYGTAGMLLGGVCAMLLTRRYGRPLAERLVGGERLDRWENMQATQSLLAWSILFLAPVGDIPYFLAGLSRLSVVKVVLISAITRGPTIFLIAGASSGATGMTTTQLVWTIGGLVLIFGLLARYQQPVLAWFDRHIHPRFSSSGQRAGVDEEKLNEISLG